MRETFIREECPEIGHLSRSGFVTGNRYAGTRINLTIRTTGRLICRLCIILFISVLCCCGGFLADTPPNVLS